MKKELSEKKKLLRLILLWTACLAAGVAVGLLVGRTLKGDAPDLPAMLTAAAPGLSTILAIIFALINVLPLIWSWLRLNAIRRQAATLDPDDDETYERLEQQLGLPMVLSSVIQVVDMAFFAVLMDLALQSSISRQRGIILVIVSAVIFLGALFVSFAIAKRSVDQEKQLNPEKRGSLLDLSFQKTWEASCDEAQKQMIHEAGYRAFRAGSTACLALWLITLLAMFALHTGFFPVLCVCAVWLVLQLAYYHAAGRLEHGRR